MSLKISDFYIPGTPHSKSWFQTFKSDGTPPFNKEGGLNKEPKRHEAEKTAGLSLGGLGTVRLVLVGSWGGFGGILGDIGSPGSRGLILGTPPNRPWGVPGPDARDGAGRSGTGRERDAS